MRGVRDYERKIISPKLHSVENGGTLDGRLRTDSLSCLLNERRSVVRDGGLLLLLPLWPLKRLRKSASAFGLGLLARFLVATHPSHHEGNPGHSSEKYCSRFLSK